MTVVADRSGGESSESIRITQIIRFVAILALFSSRLCTTLNIYNVAV